MKFRWIAAALIVALALSAGVLSYVCLREPMPVAAPGEDDALLWLRCEFKLPAEKMARIAQMHEAYQGTCEDHCRKIREARMELRKLRDAKASASELAAAEGKSNAAALICITSLETHLREIASVMGGDDGSRYLAIVLPRIAHFDHAGAPNLDLDTNAATHDHAHH
ncbi:MAG: hypothetical protein IPP19_09840 [Verrucomicrobia bacterium]|nr:hypothetical protein [Verrucomicrobiota bacterium]